MIYQEFRPGLTRPPQFFDSIYLFTLFFANIVLPILKRLEVHPQTAELQRRPFANCGKKGSQKYSACHPSILWQGPINFTEPPASLPKHLRQEAKRAEARNWLGTVAIYIYIYVYIYIRKYIMYEGLCCVI